MKDSFFVMRYRTSGIYEWGEGWVSSVKMERWRSWLQSQSKNYPPFNVIPPRDSWDCHRLYTTYSIACLHPMSGLVRLDGKREVDALKRILSDLCELCGGHVEFRVQEVSYELEV